MPLKDEKTRVYRLLSMPAESAADIPELPPDPPSLRRAYDEAIRGLEANNPMSAALMFRRALQVITRDVLGAPRAKLSQELEWLLRNPNKLGVSLTSAFQRNAYILREVANQSAHPDGDADLLDLTHEDAIALYQLFLEVVHEVFSIPEAREEAKRQLMKRRRLAFPTAPVPSS